ncbi:hypothetical protein BC832DRAFT_595042 [Gaertneriomyces semiglobifer]|nr:hypothetical protein BC832DRAFT_595042 [Gaertneriomyces semiglobifer]
MSVRASKETVQRAFISGKNIALIYEEVFFLFKKSKVDIGSRFNTLAADTVRNIWAEAAPRINDAHLKAPRETILRLNQHAVGELMKLVSERIPRKRAPCEATPKKRGVSPDGVPFPSRQREERSAEPESVAADVRATPIAEREEWPVVAKLSRCTRISDVVAPHPEPVKQVKPRDTKVPDHKVPHIVRSADRDKSKFPTSSHYQVPFEFEGVTSMELLDLDVAVSGFAITPNNNRMYFAEDDDPMVTFEVEPGDYDVESLLNEVERQMNDRGKYRYKVTFDDRKLVTVQTIVQRQAHAAPLAVRADERQHS